MTRLSCTNQILAAVSLLVLAGSPASVKAAVPGAGSVYAWGITLTDPPVTTSNSVKAVAAGIYRNLALRTDGRVISWDWPPNTVPNNLTNIIAIAVGDNHGLAVRANGTVVAWGENSAGQTNVLTPLPPSVAVAAGQFHSLALTADGRVLGWGTTADRAGMPPQELQTGIFPSSAIAAGANHSLAVYHVSGFPGGRVAGWGNNTSGQARPPDNLSNGTLDVVGVAAGTTHSLALLSNGRVVGWGNNILGQAAAPSSLTNAIAIAAGGDDSAAITADGRVVVWGYHALSEPPPALSNVKAVAVGSFHRLAVEVQPLVITAPLTNQTVNLGSTTVFSISASGAVPLAYQWRYNNVEIPGANASTYTIANTQTAAEGLYTVIITAANELSTNSSATLLVNSPPVIHRQPQSATVNAGGQTNFFVEATGTGLLRYQWRKNGQNIPFAVNLSYLVQNAQVSDAGNYDVVITNNYGAVTSAVATLTVNNPPTITAHPQNLSVLEGSSASFSVTAIDATFYRWQKNGVTIPNATNATHNINSVRPADAGLYRAVVGNQFGSVLSQQAALVVQPIPPASSTNIVAWGQILFFNDTDWIDTSPPGGLGQIVGLAAGLGHSLALREDGTIVGWGDNSRTQSSPPAGLTGVRKIVAGDYHSLALTYGGTVVGWGTPAPATPPPGLTGVGDIAAGSGHSLALLANGTVAGWGTNSHGQATPPGTITGIAQIAAGGAFSLGLRTNGTVIGWGDNEDGQTRPPGDLSGVIAIAAGTGHAMALKSDGTVAVWGRNDHDQLEVPPGLANVQAIAAGANHCMARRTDGSIVCWGQNNEGQTETPPDLSGILIAAGGNRSLALTRNLFTLDIPSPLPDGGWRIRVRHANGSAILSEEIATLQILTAPTPTVPIESWIPLASPFILQSGVLIIDDTSSFFDQRFYLLIDDR